MGKYSFFCCFHSSSSRRSYSRLLLSVDNAPSCPGGGDRYVNIVSGSQSNVITIDNVTVCASGENLIVYDIGTMDSQGLFSVLISSAYSTEIYVETGQAACFRLVMKYARLERSYTRIVSDIVVELFDLGRNVSLFSFILQHCGSFVCIFTHDSRRSSAATVPYHCHLSTPMPKYHRQLKLKSIRIPATFLLRA